MAAAAVAAAGSLDATEAAIRALFAGDHAPAEGGDPASVEALLRSRWRVLRLGPGKAATDPALGFLAPAFRKAAAEGDRAVALRSLGLSAPAEGVSPRTLDNLRTLRTGTKHLLCPFTGRTEPARCSLGREWYLRLGPDGAVCLASQRSPVMANANTESFWVFPDRGLILLSRNAHPEERVLAETAKLLGLCLRHAPAVARHIAEAGAWGPARVAVTDFPCPHMGHNLWNLQTGWAKLLATAEAASWADRFLCFGGQNFFGELGELFPEAPGGGGPVVTVADDEQILREMLGSGLLLATVKDEHISPDLARRILRRARAACDPAFLAEVAALRAAARPLVVVTVRLDNRAWLEQGEGWVALFRALQEDFPGIGVILHGLSRDTTKGWTTAWMSLEAERKVAERILAGLSGRMPVVSAVGGRFAEAIVLQDAADLFIAPAGSGMALYKWISNLPGLAISNRFVLQEGTGANWALRVFHNPAFRPDVVETRHLAPALVTDEPVAERDAGRANFHLDWRDLHAASVPLIREVLAARDEAS
jgi:hypothetical protein